MIENRLGSEHLESVIEKLLRLNRYIPHTPTPKQAAFLLLPHHEILYGGAAGGGKSDALIENKAEYYCWKPRDWLKIESILRYTLHD